MKSYKVSKDIRKQIVESLNALFDKQDRFVRSYPTNVDDIAKKYNLSRTHIYYILSKSFDKKWLNDRRRRLFFQVRLKKDLYNR